MNLMMLLKCFLQYINDLINTLPKDQVLIVHGDFNAKVSGDYSYAPDVAGLAWSEWLLMKLEFTSTIKVLVTS